MLFILWTILHFFPFSWVVFNAWNGWFGIRIFVTSWQVVTGKDLYCIWPPSTERWVNRYYRVFQNNRIFLNTAGSSKTISFFWKLRFKCSISLANSFEALWQCSKRNRRDKQKFHDRTVFSLVPISGVHCHITILFSVTLPTLSR